MDIQKKAMVEALEKSLGIVTTACKMVGICRSSHYDWYNNDMEYKEALDFGSVVRLLCMIGDVQNALKQALETNDA